MVEIKIRFKSGEIAYFKLENYDIKKLFDRLGDSIKDGAKGVIELIDLVDDKRTIVNFDEIASFGYSEVE
ncbi:hypothetical protein [Clostridium tertium]|uniref:hypothetical protein n=1 Tax=Clostridium tertium TaxID=1559 RepID=UPI0024B3C4A7|nr:hypothetical protein [Clostridium tertium]MDI9215965.1 hypothetical protein [Clostridium tertium]